MLHDHNSCKDETKMLSCDWNSLTMPMPPNGYTKNVQKLG